MVQAGYDYARDWDTQTIYEPTEKVRQVKRTYRKINRKKTWMFKLSVCLFIYALLVVYLCIRGAVLGYQIVNLEKDINVLETSQNRMEYEIAEKTSLERIEQVAQNELGMHRAEEHMLIMAFNANNEEIKPEQMYPESAEKQTAERSLEKLYTNLRHLAAKNN